MLKNIITLSVFLTFQSIHAAITKHERKDLQYQATKQLFWSIYNDELESFHKAIQNGAKIHCYFADISLDDQIEILQEKGGNLHLMENLTPLHMTAYHGQAKFVQTLLQNGASPFLKSRRTYWYNPVYDYHLEKTPLERMFMQRHHTGSGYCRVVQLLLKKESQILTIMYAQKERAEKFNKKDVIDMQIWRKIFGYIEP